MAPIICTHRAHSRKKSKKRVRGGEHTIEKSSYHINPKSSQRVKQGHIWTRAMAPSRLYVDLYADDHGLAAPATAHATASPTKQPPHLDFKPGSVVLADSDLLQSCLFPFLGIRDYCALAKTCRSLLNNCSLLSQQQLEALCCVEDAVTDEDVAVCRDKLHQYLATNRHFRFLNLRFVSGLVNDSTLLLLAGLPLEKLKLRMCKNVTNLGFEHLKTLPLTYLDLYGCHQITDTGLASLAHLPLQHIDLTLCRELSPKAHCKYYAIFCENLRKLSAFPSAHQHRLVFKVC